jgi:hypothetical protein
MFQDEPGFRELRFGDILDERLLSAGSSNNDSLAETFTQFAVEAFAMQDVPDLTFHLSVAIEISDALLTRAFLTDPHGDPRYITVCRTVVREYLEHTMLAEGGQVTSCAQSAELPRQRPGGQTDSNKPRA